MKKANDLPLRFSKDRTKVKIVLVTLNEESPFYDYKMAALDAIVNCRMQKKIPRFQYEKMLDVVITAKKLPWDMGQSADRFEIGYAEEAPMTNIWNFSLCAPEADHGHFYCTGTTIGYPIYEKAIGHAVVLALLRKKIITGGDANRMIRQINRTHLPLLGTVPELDTIDRIRAEQAN
ncbi:MAG: hypothetical protein WDN09_02865 [bacterium]